MIRTATVTLTSMPAVAYRQKLAAGGSGIVIISRDCAQAGIAAISKTSGEAIPTVNTPALYTAEAFAEAMELTAGMPYKKCGGVKYADNRFVEIEETDTEALPEEAVVTGAAYKAVVDAYTDKAGRLSYDLLNRDLIQFAHKSTKVQEMIADMASEEVLAAYVTGVKFRDITGDHELSDAQVQKILEMLDEVSPKGVLRAFKDEMRLRLKESKKTR